MRNPILALAFSAAAFAAPRAGTVTFYQHVLPVLQDRCQGCHRPGEAAPMSFLTYQETRPWAKAIKAAVANRRMPPWFAEPGVGPKFHNDRSLSDADRLTLTQWADSGAPAGNPKEAPAAKRFVDGWNIGHPDFTVEMPLEYEVPASGTIEYTYFVVPTTFTEDRWVEQAEVRPGDRRLVHHVIAFIREPGSKWLKDAKPGEAFIPKKGSGDGEGGGRQAEFLVGYAPGTIPVALKPGQAKLIKAGSDIVLQMHYTANGTAGKDRTKVGFRFSREAPQERVFMLAASNNKFVIPAGAGNYRVESKFTVQSEVKLEGLLPHMHLRGKSFEYRITFPNGEKRTLLSVPRYDFNWQLSYLLDQPILMPKGTVIECTAHFDNSANNPHNPDPKSEVRWGDQSWEEMMIGFFEVSFDAKRNPRDLFQAPRQQPQTSGE